MSAENIKKSIKEIEQNLTILKVEVNSIIGQNEALLKENKKLKERLKEQASND